MRENSRISGAIGFHILLDRMYIRYLIVSVINRLVSLPRWCSSHVQEDHYRPAVQRENGVFVRFIDSGLAFVLILAYKTSWAVSCLSLIKAGVCVVLCDGSSS